MPTTLSQIPLSTENPRVCSDAVVGAILSGWRYDISGIPVDLRGDYEAHLEACPYCRRRQRLHRTVDLLLLAVTSLSFAAFLLAALVMRRLEALSHLSQVHLRVPLHNAAAAIHIPGSITISLQAVALAGVFVSLLLWTLVAITTPISNMAAEFFQSRARGEDRERERKRAA